jgi:UDP-N-acetyl-D-mannosaminuronate dehydrogenase
MTWGEESALASKLLMGEAERIRAEVKLVKAARRVNEETLSYVVKTLSKLLKERGKPLAGARIILLGISSKADVKEDRASPARLLVAALKRKGARVKAWDPLYSLDELRSLGYEPAVLWEALPKADCVMVTVGHQAFKKLKTRIISELSAKGGGILFDCSETGVFAGLSSDKVTVSGLGF